MPTLKLKTLGAHLKGQNPKYPKIQKPQVPTLKYKNPKCRP